MLFVELFNPPLLSSSDLMSSFLYSGSSKTVSEVSCSSCVSAHLSFCSLQRCKVQVQKVKVLLSILFQSPGFANYRFFSQET